MYNLIVGRVAPWGEYSTFSPIPTNITGAEVLSMKICTVDGCNTQTLKTNLCQKHYLRWWKYKDTSFVKFHYKTDTPVYRSWNHMKQRCLNHKNDAYKDYGGRGITVCDRWLDFKNFFADMGDRLECMQLDRTDNNGNYEPGNCRWVTAKVNMNNRRKNPHNKPMKKLNPDQVREIRKAYPIMKQKQIAKKYNLNPSTISYIILRKTWRDVI